MSDIEKSYPVPSRAPRGKWVDLFVRMRPGESVVVDLAGLKGLTTASIRQRGKSSIRQKKITPEAFRVWRVK